MWGQPPSASAGAQEKAYTLKDWIMNTELAELASITMPKGTLLVLFEYLAGSYDTWHRSSETPEESTFALQQPDAGERKALWHLEGVIESTLTEIFSPEYKQLVAEWKQHLISN